jgi:hypothetical protein
MIGCRAPVQMTNGSARHPVHPPWHDALNGASTSWPRSNRHASLPAKRRKEVVHALFETYEHRHCGVYANVVQGGRVSVDDAAVEMAQPVLRVAADA